MSRGSLFSQLLTPAHRAAPQELWAELRDEPVSLQDDGTWVITGYDEVRSLSADPRISASHDQDNHAASADTSGRVANFIVEDPPEHNRDRKLVMKHFGPPHRPGFVASLEASISAYAERSLNACRGHTRMDVVDEFAYPLPVSVICDVLGVPHEDEPQFSVWTKAISLLASPDTFLDVEAAAEGSIASREAGAYMYGLVQRRKTDPGNDMISDMVNDTSDSGRLSDEQIVSNAIILLIAGHETTVNAITNGILLLLRNPEQMAQVRDNPELMPGAFEEILRLEPPVQFRDRTTLSDITINGVTIPKSSIVQLSYAAANRDPKRFDNPDRFDPERKNNQHLSFNTGLHYCFGAPLARLEGLVALNTWLARVKNPSLVQDPPPYRRNAALRGPSELLVDCERID
jgi:cytochrome P450